MKKLLSLVLVLTLVFSMFSLGTAYATDDGPSLALTGGRCTQGRMIDIYVSIKNNPGIASMRFKVVYDENAFELVGVTDLGLLNGWTVPSVVVTSPYTLRWADALATENNTANGSVAKLTFKAGETTEPGAYVFTLEFIESRNCDGVKQYFNNAASVVEVARPLKGDADDDGEITDWDSMLFERYLAAWNVEINLSVLDIDGDGEVSDWDSMLLNRYLADWPVKEFEEPTEEPTPELTEEPTEEPTEGPAAGIKKGDEVYFGKYEQDNDPTNGQEDIEWIVLDVVDGKALLMSKYALDAKPYNNTSGNVTWETSSLRAWLNGEFYNAAFADEKSAILTTALVNGNNPLYGTNGGKITYDNVFILGLNDITNIAYGFIDDYEEEDATRRIVASEYAKAQGCATETNKNKIGYGCCNWWIRTPGFDNSIAVYVCINGDVDPVGDYATNSSNGVCPAIWVKVDAPVPVPEPTPEPTPEPLSTPNPNIKAGDTVAFGKYEQDNNLSNGQEDIEWIVLDVVDGKALLMSKYALDAKPYNGTYTDVTWKTCTLRSWLNGEFYNSAFSAGEKSIISMTMLVNADNPLYGTSGGKNTTDNVFLLSIDDVTNTTYGFSSSYDDFDEARRCQPTEYAKAQGCGYDNDLNSSYYGNCYWWLRSPGDISRSKAVHSIGGVPYDGYIVNYDSIGVRPALWINLDSSSEPTPEPTPEPITNVKAGDIITFGKYEQDNITSNGQEDIEWIVLDVVDGKALLMSKYALDCKPYNNSSTSVTWETCTLRTWLNSEFYNAAFSAGEKSIISMAMLVNADNPSNGTSGGNNTADNVFLLSLDDIKNTTYGFSSSYYDYDEARRCQPTEYAKAQGCWYDSDLNSSFYGNCWWWLRSPGEYSYFAAGVNNGGRDSDSGSNVSNLNRGVRPALWINLDSSVEPTTEPTAEPTTEPTEEPTEEPLSTPNPNIKAGDRVAFGKYEQDNDLINGQEDIEWIVLDVVDGKALLMSKYALDSKPYNQTWTDVTWETCTLRTWLNGEFYNSAFSAGEKNIISMTTLVNADNPWYGTSGGNNTADNVFLLSLDDVLNTSYGFSSSYSTYDEARRCQPTEYAKAREIYYDSDFSSSYYGNCYWWLRSPGGNAGSAAIVDNRGYVEYYGYGVDISGLGVRPALWINLDASAMSEPIKDVKTGDIVTFGKYEQDNDLSNGQEDIEWIVLDVVDGKALLMSKYALDAKPYNETNTDVTWETCTLRTWLNGEFYNSAFSAGERNIISKTMLVNADEPTFGTSGGNNTSDNVFLLSIDDVLNTSYGFSSSYSTYDEARRCQPTEYAKAQGCYYDSDLNSSYCGNCYWWLRSPGGSRSAAYVLSYGYVDRSGYVGSNYIGVRPALWINLDSSVEPTTEPTTEPTEEPTEEPLSTPNPNIKAGDRVAFGKYEQDNDLSNGQEDIEWIVLDVVDGKALLMSKYALDAKPFNETNTNVTWETCTLRSWLNGEFYNSAFSTGEKNRISVTTLVNADNPWYGTSGGKNTTDNVFLLSIDDVMNTTYGFSSSYSTYDEARRCQPTEYAKARGCWYASDLNSSYYGNCSWWLRSPGRDSNSAAGVNYGGYVLDRGRSVDDNNYSFGVRPALWINLDS